MIVSVGDEGTRLGDIVFLPSSRNARSELINAENVGFSAMTLVQYSNTSNAWSMMGSGSV